MNDFDHNGKNILMVTAKNILLEKGADINAIDNQGNNALIYSTYNYNRWHPIIAIQPQIVQLLIKNGADIDHNDMSAIDYIFQNIPLRDAFKKKFLKQ